ncbi:MAG: septum formation initiator family protein [Actinomycetota bacterium]|nr:septum formation initiator family protein [Actinomycetota bacterium]
MRRHPGLVVAVLAMLGVLVLGAFPVRAYLDQLRQREELAARVRSLSDENRRLQTTAADLQAVETIERLARERYQLVRPGEEAYAILPHAQPPAPPEPDRSPTAAVPPTPGGSWLSRTWARVMSVF